MPAPVYPSYHLTTDRTESALEHLQYAQRLRRHLDGALMHLCLAFLMTGDARYAEPAKRILLEVADWPTDDTDVTSVSATWGGTGQG